MSNSFTGLNVQVKLKHPPSTLHGHVAEVRGQQLLLSNVTFLKTGKRLHEYNVHGAEIEDIEVLSQEDGEVKTPTSTQPQPAPVRTQTVQSIVTRQLSNGAKATSDPPTARFRPAQLPPTTNTSYQDPAILSFQRTPMQSHATPAPPAQPSTSPGVASGRTVALTAPVDVINEAKSSKGGSSVIPQFGQMKHMETPRTKLNEGSDNSYGIDGTSTRGIAAPVYEDDPIQSGWRQTPILQPQAPSASPKPIHTSGISKGKPTRGVTTPAKQPNGHRQRALDKEASKNGWGTEDATDLKDMGDFDFEDNLSKFDKRAVWAELRAGNTTADEDRLVSFNRVKMPGTFGGQKLHPTENVLGGNRKVSPEFDDTESELDLAASSSSRKLLRSLSRTSRRPPSRKDSLRTEVQASAPSMSSRSISRRALTEHAALPPQSSGYVASPPSSSFSTSAPQVSLPNKPHLCYLGTSSPCRTVNSDTLQAIETLAKNGFGMTDDILAENAGRGIAEAIISTIDPSGTRLIHTNHNSAPVVVMLVGETKVGARALAAARHLLERNVRVVAGLTGPVDLEQGVLSVQTQRLRGKVIRSWSETTAYLATLDAPPELIVDGIIGAEDISGSPAAQHHKTMADMIAWASSSKASVLSIDIQSSLITGSPESCRWPDEIQAKIIIVCGIPLSTLVNRLADDSGSSAIRVFVVDIGLNPAARPFMKLRTQDVDDSPKGRFIQFGSKWLVPLRFKRGANDG